MKIEIYEDQIVKNICHSLETEFDRWQPVSSSNYNFSDDDKHIRDDNVIIAFTSRAFTIYNKEDVNCILYVYKKENLENIVSSIRKMKINKEIASGKKLLHKLGIHTRSEKLKKLNEM